MTAQTTYEYDVFLSHNKAQKDWTLALVRRLRDGGLNVWFDDWRLEGGVNWTVALWQGVQESHHVCLTMSQEFLDNEWPKLEMYIAILDDPSAGKRKIIPLLHSPCDMPPELAFRQALDFQETHDNPDLYEFRLEQLLADLGANQERPNTPSSWLAGAGGVVCFSGGVGACPVGFGRGHGDGHAQRHAPA